MSKRIFEFDAKFSVIYKTYKVIADTEEEARKFLMEDRDSYEYDSEEESDFEIFSSMDITDQEIQQMLGNIRYLKKQKTKYAEDKISEYKRALKDILGD